MRGVCLLGVVRKGIMVFWGREGGGKCVGRWGWPGMLRIKGNGLGSWGLGGGVERESGNGSGM